MPVLISDAGFKLQACLFLPRRPRYTRCLNRCLLALWNLAFRHDDNKLAICRTGARVVVDAIAPSFMALRFPGHNNRHVFSSMLGLLLTLLFPYAAPR